MPGRGGRAACCARPTTITSSSSRSTRASSRRRSTRCSQYLGATTLILTGIAGNICVLFTANDAYMRDYNIVVPADCIVSNTGSENDHALEQIERVLKGTVTPSDQLDLAELVARAHRRR